MVCSHRNRFGFDDIPRRIEVPFRLPLYALAVRESIPLAVSVPGRPIPHRDCSDRHYALANPLADGAALCCGLLLRRMASKDAAVGRAFFSAAFRFRVRDPCQRRRLNVLQVCAIYDRHPTSWPMVEQGGLPLLPQSHHGSFPALRVPYLLLDCSELLRSASAHHPRGVREVWQLQEAPLGLLPLPPRHHEHEHALPHRHRRRTRAHRPHVHHLQGGDAA
mmetsp:Transcript_38015/g.77996  ORF Transcript_38015/g.77996 Transcript_38015/m.77996 type:complete len:220 (-) Transcript_38015:205-864(-)